MTVEVEIKDEKGLALLRQLETFDILKLKESVEQHTKPAETTIDKKRIERIRSLRGSLNMGPERIKEFEAYLQEMRNELE